MILNFSGLSRKFILANKNRVLISILCVSLTVGLMVSIYSLFNKMEQSLKDETKEIYGDTDIRVGYNVDSGQYLDNGQLQKIEKLNGVESYSRLLINPKSNNKNNKDVSSLEKSIYYLGTDNSKLAKGLYKYSKDIGKNEIIISSNLANDLKVKESDNVKLQLPGVDAKIWTVVEVIPNIKGSSVPNIAIFNINSLQEWFGYDDISTLMLLKLKQKVDKSQVSNSLRLINKDLRIEVIEDSEYVSKNLQSIRVIGFSLGIIALVISALFLMTNFRLFIHEYQRELAILRAIGGNSTQSFNLVLNQAIFIVFSGTFIGLLLGFLCSTYLSNVFGRLFKVSISAYSFRWGEPLLICVLNIIFSLLLLVFPIMRSVKILPIQSMRENEQIEFKNSVLSRWMVLISIFIGTILIFISKFINGDGGIRALTSVLGGILITIGIFRGVTFFIKPMLTALLPVWKLMGGEIAFISIKNIINQTKQNTLVILALAGAFTITIPVTSILETVKHNSLNSIHVEYVSDIVLSSSYGSSTNLKFDFGDKIREISGVKEVIPISRINSSDITFRRSSTKIGKESVINYGFADLSLLSTLEFLPELGPNKNNCVVLPKDYANTLGLEVGDEFKVVKRDFGYKGDGVTLKVAAVLDVIPGITNPYEALVDWSNTGLLTDRTILDKALIQIDKSKKEEVLKGLKTLKTEYPEIKWSTLEEALASADNLIKQRYSILGLVVVVIILIGIFSMITTLTSYIETQRREYAILRAISVTPNQLFKMVLSQSFLYSFVGIIVGTITGIIMAYAIGIGLDGAIVFPWTIYVFMIVSMVFISILFTLPIAKRISSRSVTEELVTIAK